MLVCLLLSAEIFCLELALKRLTFSFQKHRMSRDFCCLFTGGWHRGYPIKDLVCTRVIFFSRYVLFYFSVLFYINLHTKRAKYTETKHCVSLIVSVIKYGIKCVFGHTKRVVLACCERVITFVPEITWRVTNNQTAVYTSAHINF